MACQLTPLPPLPETPCGKHRHPTGTLRGVVSYCEQIGSNFEFRIREQRFTVTNMPVPKWMVLGAIVEVEFFADGGMGIGLVGLPDTTQDI